MNKSFRNGLTRFLQIINHNRLLLKVTARNKRIIIKDVNRWHKTAEIHESLGLLWTSRQIKTGREKNYEQILQKTSQSSKPRTRDVQDIWRTTILSKKDQ